MPPRRARQTNVRGYELLPPTRRGLGGGNRRAGTEQGRLVEEAEKETAAWLRGRSGTIGTDDIVLQAQRTMRRMGVTDYYLLRAGLGSATASSWVQRFRERWGIARVPLNTRFRARRGGFDIAQQVMRGWDTYFLLLERLEEEVGNADELELTLFSFDETNLRRVVARSMLLGQEALEDFGGSLRRGHLEAEVVQLDCSLGVCICSNDQVGPVEPMVSVNGVPQGRQDVLYDHIA